MRGKEGEMSDERGEVRGKEGEKRDERRDVRGKEGEMREVGVRGELSKVG